MKLKDKRCLSLREFSLYKCYGIDQHKIRELMGWMHDNQFWMDPGIGIYLRERKQITPSWLEVKLFFLE
jgi:hypothetical protein